MSQLVSNGSPSVQVINGNLDNTTSGEVILTSDPNTVGAFDLTLKVSPLTKVTITFSDSNTFPNKVIVTSLGSPISSGFPLVIENRGTSEITRQLRITTPSLSSSDLGLSRYFDVQVESVSASSGVVSQGLTPQFNSGGNTNSGGFSTVDDRTGLPVIDSGFEGGVENQTGGEETFSGGG